MRLLIFQNFLALTSEKQNFYEIVEHGIIEFFGTDWKENTTNTHCQVKNLKISYLYSISLRVRGCSTFSEKLQCRSFQNLAWVFDMERCS